MLLLFACTPTEPDPVRLTADLTYALSASDGALACSGVVAWLGEGTAAACEGCDFQFDVVASEVSAEGEACGAFDGLLGFGQYDAGDVVLAFYEDWSGYYYRSPVFADIHERFVLRQYGYTAGFRYPLACADGCAPLGTLSRDGDALTWTAAATDTGDAGTAGGLSITIEASGSIVR